jgi:hypothetical protein
VLEVVSLAEWVLNDIVKSRFFGVRIHEFYLKFGKCLVKFHMFLTEILNLVDVDEENRHSCFTFGISVDSIIHQE